MDPGADCPVQCVDVRVRGDLGGLAARPGHGRGGGGAGDVARGRSAALVGGDAAGCELSGRLVDVEGALLATHGPGADAEEVVRRLAVPAVAAQLAEIGVPDPTALPTVAGEQLRMRLGPGPVVTDDDPRIEQFAASLPETGGGTDGAGLVFARAMWGP